MVHEALFGGLHPKTQGRRWWFDGWLHESNEVLLAEEKRKLKDFHMLTTFMTASFGPFACSRTSLGTDHTTR
jgi:hypothetical protein